jgi:hypothetical protein
MADYLSLGGARAYELDITIPYLGMASGDIKMAQTDATLTGAQVLVIGTMTVQCSIYRIATFAGETIARIFGGFGGWNTNLGPQGYQNPGGIMASTLLQDAAANVGEQVNVVADYSVGNFFAREGGNPPVTASVPAGKLLRQLASCWWIDFAGVTQVQSARPSNTIQSDFQVVNYDPGRGLFDVTTESPQDWQPGNTFASMFLPGTSTISSTRIHCKESGEMALHVLAA